MYKIIEQYKINSGKVFIIKYDNVYALEFYDNTGKYTSCTHSVNNLQTAKKIIRAFYPGAKLIRGIY